MANDFVARRHVKSAGIFAEWYLKPGTSAKQENFATSIWRQIFQQPLIPYSVNDRRATLQHAYDELHDEVAAWEATLDEERRLKASRQERLPVGSYPSFTHANQVKTYLRQNGVTRRVIARKVIVPPVADSPPGFAVYVDYTRAELTEINLATPKTGDPFNVEIDRSRLPEFALIERLLQGSNASLPSVASPKDHD